MTAQVSRSVPQLSLIGSMRIEGDLEPLHVAELEREDLQEESKTCIGLLLQGNRGLKAKTNSLRDGRAPTRLSSALGNEKVIDLRQTRAPKAQEGEPPAKGTGSFQDEIKSYRGGTKVSKKKGKPSDPINIPCYSRGQDPGPWMRGTFMEQPAKHRAAIVDSHKRSYEAKYENYLRRKRNRNENSTEAQQVILVDSENVRVVKQGFAEMDREKTGAVGKQVIMKYFHDNPSFARLFDLEFLSDIDDYLERTEEVLGNIGMQENVLDLDEFLSFYQISKNNKEPSISMISEQISIAGKSGPCVLPRVLVDLMKDLFTEVNRDNTPAVDSDELLARLRMEMDIQASIDIPAVNLDGETITLGQVLDRLAEISAKSHLLSWKDIEKQLCLPGTKAEEIDKDFILLPEEDVKLLREVFLGISGNEETADRLSVVCGMREKPELAELLSVKVREPRGVSPYPEETLEQLLARIAESEGEELSWDEFLAYLTSGGSPEQGNEYESDPERYEPESPRSHTSEKARSLSSERIAPLGERYAITVPKPFSFNTRERAKRKPIRQIKLEAMLVEKERKEMEPCLVRIRATPVPAEVIIPRYEEITQRNEDRRRQVKMASVEMTKRNEKPFSFYFRDMNKVKPAADFYPEPFVFKANPVPWESTVPLLERMRTEGEELRKMRIEERAKELFSQSHLPPRMELHKNEGNKKEARPRMQSAHMTHSKPVPDFATLQKSFQKELESRKQAFKATIPQPFHFNESRKTAQYREYMDDPDALQRWTPPQAADLEKVFRRPSREPSSTEKHKALVELRKKEQQQQEAVRLAREQEENARAERRDRMKPIVQQSEVIVDNTRAMSERREQAVKEYKRQAKEQERQYQIEMAEMMERVYARPLMVEQVTENARRNARDLPERHNRRSEEGMDSDMPFSEDEQPYANERRAR